MQLLERIVSVLMKIFFIAPTWKKAFIKCMSVVKESSGRIKIFKTHAPQRSSFNGSFI